MQITFLEKHLRHICESQLAAQRKLGTAVSTTLRRRLADLRAADNLAELPVGRPQESLLNGGPHILLELSDSTYLVMLPNHSVWPRDQNGTALMNKITKVQLVAISTLDEALT